MNATIKDVAKLANVSVTTVSKVMNNKGEISEATKKRVLGVIDELNYKPNALARGMITKKTRTIGLILPDICNPFYPDVARGVEDGASKFNYNIFLCNTDNSTKKEKNYINILIEKRVDGIIFTSSLSPKQDNIINLKKSGIPVVYMDRRVEYPDEINGVYINNFVGGYLATKHLIDLGHTKIGCITGNLKTLDSIERFEGYKKALKDSDISLNNELIAEGNYDIESGYECVDKLLSSNAVGKDITSIFACNDLMAYGAYKLFKQKGIRIPDDISIIGFDDIVLGQMLEPNLSTIRQPMYDMGSIASNMLIKMIEGKKLKENVVILQPELIVRSSTREL